MKQEMKRLIALGGGGPAVGLGLGVLRRISESPDMRFDVWTTACAGAWLGMAYNIAPPGKEYDNALKFCQNNMRPDDLISAFPIPGQFVPDFTGIMENIREFLNDPRSLENLYVPQHWPKAFKHMMEILNDSSRWNNCELNPMILNDIMAVNPISRLMASLLYRSRITGLAKMYYDDCNYKDNALNYNIEDIFKPGKPTIYHNLYNITKSRVELLINSKTHPKYKPMTMKSLRAGSALPYIIEPIEIDGDMCCEGAMVDTINFKDVIRNHPDLDEIWVVRLLNLSQIKEPKSLLDALNNLIMLFAATMSEDAIAMLRFRLEKRRMRTRVIEVPVTGDILYEWSESNLQRSIEHGYRHADSIISKYKPRFILSPQFETMKVITRHATTHETIGDEYAMEELSFYNKIANTQKPFSIVISELAELLSLVVKHMDVARKAGEGKRDNEISSYEDEIETRATIITEALQIFYFDSTNAKSGELIKICINLTEMVYSLSRDIAEFVLTVGAHADNEHTVKHSRIFIESMDIVLMTLCDTLKEPLKENLDLLAKMVFDHSEMMIAYRNDNLGLTKEHNTKQSSGLFVLTDLVEKYFDNVNRIIKRFRRYLDFEKILKDNKVI
ncbi:MAG: patatin-like phospholipase family protein [Nitrospirae bacterium YQR-1]